MKKSPKKVVKKLSKKSSSAKKSYSKAARKAITGLPQVADAPEAPAQDAKTLALRQESVGIAAQAKLMRVTDAQSMTDATNMLVTVARLTKDLESHRATMVRPLKEHIKMIEATYFKPGLEQLEIANTELRTKVLAYRRVEQDRADKEREEAEAAAIEAEAKAAELAEAGNTRAANKMAEEATALAVKAVTVDAPTRVMSTADSQVAARKVWRFEIEDMGSVPDEYWVVDEGAIRAAIRSGLRSIAGVRIFEEETLAVGGR